MEKKTQSEKNLNETVKAKESTRKKDNEKLNELLKKIDENRWSIILFVVGFLLATLIFRCIFWPERIAKLKDGTEPVATLKDETITADDLYEIMKEQYSVSYLLNKIDAIILEKKYKEDDEMKENINNTAEYYYSMYEKNYGYTKETFLSENGFSSEAKFLDTLRLNYRRNKYYEDYALSLVTDKEIEKYYENDVFGDIDTKHILVSIKDEDGLTDEEAKKLANDIIKELDNGTSWEDVIKNHKDEITSEELGYQAFNASLESAYLKEMKDLKVDTYSKTPVLTSYGYHIIYKIAEKEKPKLEDVKDDIKEVLAKEKKNADNNLYYKALIKMREDAKLEFADTVLGEQYKKYVNNYE